MRLFTYLALGGLFLTGAFWIWIGAQFLRTFEPGPPDWLAALLVGGLGLLMATVSVRFAVRYRADNRRRTLAERGARTTGRVVRSQMQAFKVFDSVAVEATIGGQLRTFEDHSIPARRPPLYPVGSDVEIRYLPDDLSIFVFLPVEQAS